MACPVANYSCPPLFERPSKVTTSPPPSPLTVLVHSYRVKSTILSILSLLYSLLYYPYYHCYTLNYTSLVIHYLQPWVDHYFLSISHLMDIVNYTPQGLHQYRVLLEVLLCDLGDPGRTIGYHLLLIDPRSGFRFLWFPMQLSSPRDLPWSPCCLP